MKGDLLKLNVGGAYFTLITFNKLSLTGVYFETTTSTLAGSGEGVLVKACTFFGFKSKNVKRIYPSILAENF